MIKGAAIAMPSSVSDLVFHLGVATYLCKGFPSAQFIVLSKVLNEVIAKVE